MITVYGNNISLDQLENVPLERPKKAGRYWQGIRHGDLANTIQEETQLRSWEITGSKFALSKDRADLAGAFDLRIPGTDAPEGQTLSLGFLTSNAMRRRLTIVVGSTVAVCNNGMATGEIVLNKKHTSGFNVYEQVEEALDQYVIKARQIPALVAGLRERQLSSQESNQIILEAGRQSILPWSRLGDVDKEFRIPTFAEHGKGSSWTMLNAFTWVVKRSPAISQMGRINQFRELLPIASGA